MVLIISDSNGYLNDVDAYAQPHQSFCTCITHMDDKGFSLVFCGCLVTRHARCVSIFKMQNCSTEDHSSSVYATLIKRSHSVL